MPGVWVDPPTPGYLWTPSYWAYSGGYYGWHSGYWGEHVGFYGGVNYGYGYGGNGFGGGRWEGSSFRYNTAVVNVNTTAIHNTYEDRTVINTINNRSSFNGSGRISSQPTATEQAAVHENHIEPTTEQNSNHLNASKDRSQFASVNRGHPSTLVTHSMNNKNTLKAYPTLDPKKDREQNSTRPNSPTLVPASKPIEHHQVERAQREQHVSKPKKEVTSPSKHHPNPERSQPKVKKD